MPFTPIEQSQQSSFTPIEDFDPNTIQPKKASQPVLGKDPKSKAFEFIGKGLGFVSPTPKAFLPTGEEARPLSRTQQAAQQLVSDPRATGLQRFVGRTAQALGVLGEPSQSVLAGAVPALSAGLISKEKFRETVGIPEREQLETFGTGLGIAAQIPLIATGTQALGRGLGGIKGITGLGKAIQAGGITTAATEGAIFGAAREGTLAERAKAATFGGVAGGVIGGLLKVPQLFKGLQKKFANIDEGLESVLNPVKNLSKQEQAQFIKTGLSQPERAKKLERFLASAEQNAANPRAASAMDLAIDSVEKARGQIDDLVKTAGKNVGAAKTAAGDKVVSGIDDVINSVKEDAAKRFNIKISDKGTFSKIKGREKLISGSDITRLKRVFKELQSLKKNPTLFRTNDIIKRIDDTVDLEKAILKQEKLEKFIKQTRGKLNEKQIASDKLLGEANKRFSELKEIQQSIFKATGDKQQRTVTVLKRALSERGKDIKDLFQTIAKETGDDLFEDIVFAKFATESLGGSQANSVLEQVIGKAVTGGKAGVVGKLIEATSDVIAPRAGIAREIAKEPVKKAPTILEGLRR
jgi:hypothetical protein